MAGLPSSFLSENSRSQAPLTLPSYNDLVQSLAPDQPTPRHTLFVTSTQDANRNTLGNTFARAEDANFQGAPARIPSGLVYTRDTQQRQKIGPRFISHSRFAVGNANPSINTVVAPVFRPTSFDITIKNSTRSVSALTSGRCADPNYQLNKDPSHLLFRSSQLHPSLLFPVLFGICHMRERPDGVSHTTETGPLLMVNANQTTVDTCKLAKKAYGLKNCPHDLIFIGHINAHYLSPEQLKTSTITCGTCKTVLGEWNILKYMNHIASEACLAAWGARPLAF